MCTVAAMIHYSVLLVLYSTVEVLRANRCHTKVRVPSFRYLCLVVVRTCGTCTCIWVQCAFYSMHTKMQEKDIFTTNNQQYHDDRRPHCHLPQQRFTSDRRDSCCISGKFDSVLQRLSTSLGTHARNEIHSCPSRFVFSRWSLVGLIMDGWK